MTEERDESFEAVRERLDEIVEEVNAEDITLDEALSLYEEAVKLGLSACDLSEEDVLQAIDSGELDGVGGDDSADEIAGDAASNADAGDAASDADAGDAACNAANDADAGDAASKAASENSSDNANDSANKNASSDADMSME